MKKNKWLKVLGLTGFLLLIFLIVFGKIFLEFNKIAEQKAYQYINAEVEKYFTTELTFPVIKESDIEEILNIERDEDFIVALETLLDKKTRTLPIQDIYTKNSNKAAFLFPQSYELRVSLMFCKRPEMRDTIMSLWLKIINYKNFFAIYDFLLGKYNNIYNMMKGTDYISKAPPHIIQKMITTIPNLKESLLANYLFLEFYGANINVRNLSIILKNINRENYASLLRDYEFDEIRKVSSLIRHCQFYYLLEDLLTEKASSGGGHSQALP